MTSIVIHKDIEGTGIDIGDTVARAYSYSRSSVGLKKSRVVGITENTIILDNIAACKNPSDKCILLQKGSHDLRGKLGQLIQVIKGKSQGVVGEIVGITAHKDWLGFHDVGECEITIKPKNVQRKTNVKAKFKNCEQTKLTKILYD